MSFNQESIYYEIHGEGPPLVILNGIMMSTASWHIFLDQLKGFSIILIDFIDQGQTSDCEESYSHDLQVELIHHVLTTLKCGPVYMTGISYGAQIALQYAIKYGHNLLRLAVFNCSAFTTPWLEDIGKAWQGAARTEDPDLFYHVAIPYVYSNTFYNNNAEWMYSRKKLLQSVFTPVFLRRMDRLIESSVAYDVRESLHLIQVPTLVVTSDKDYITPAAEGCEIHKAIQGSHYLMLEQCGHASMYEKPNEFVTMLIGFMNLDDNIKIL